ncbi:hypothetical protein Tco_0339672 [Tanacetum coccineum]
MREVDGTIEGKFSEHCGGNDGIGGSKFRVGEGKVVSMGGIRGGAFVIRSIVSKDGRGGIVKKGRTQEVGVKKKDKNGALFIEEDLS